jgi:hypothetical protein
MVGTTRSAKVDNEIRRRFTFENPKNAFGLITRGPVFSKIIEGRDHRKITGVNFLLK